MKINRLSTLSFTIVLLLALPTFDVSPQTAWTNDAGNPLLSDGFRLLDPCVLYNSTSGQYDLWYTDGYSVKRGVSPDGIAWSLTGASQNLASLFSAHYTSAVEVVRIGETYYLYCTCEAQDRQSVYISLATSPDGNVWTKHPGSPVLLNGALGTWESRTVGWAKIAVRNGRYYMFYLGAVGDTGSVGLATSTDGVSWQKYAYNPVLDVRALGFPNVVEIFPSGALYKEPSFQLLFHKVRQPGISADSIHLATSADGITWSIYTGNPVLTPGASGAWNAGGIGGGSLRYRNGKFRLWYQGHEQVPPGGFVAWKMGGASSVDAEPGFWRSLDGPLDGQINCVAADHRELLFAGTFTVGLHRSTNGGAVWTKVHPSTFASLLIGHGGAIIGGTDADGILRSTDGGTSWLSAGSGVSDTNIPALAMDNEGRLYAGGGSGAMYRSTDNGESWSTLTALGSPVYGFAFKDGGKIFVSSLGGGVTTSSDDGASWSVVNNGLTNLNAQSVAIDPTGRVLVGTDDGVFRSSDNGESWSKVSAWSSQVHDVIATSGGDVYAGAFHGVYVSTDMGDSWTLTNSGLTNTNVGAATLDPGGHLLIGTWGGGTFRSSEPLRPATVQGEYLADGRTVGLWHCDETGTAVVSDASAQGNHGISSNTSSLRGRFAGARSFTGVGARIEAPHASSMDWTTTRQLTFEAWVSPTTNQHQVLGFKGATSVSPYPTEWAVVIEPDKTVRFKVNADASNNVYSYLVSTQGIPLHTWTHVACTWDGTAGTMKIYLNGVLAGTSSAIANMVSMPEHPVTLGFVGDGPFTGTMDEVRISNVARFPGDFNLQLPPKNVLATTTPTAINLNWQNGGGGIGLLLYRIYRGADSTNMVLIDSTSGTSYQDRQVSPGMGHFYRIGAVDLTGFEGTRSAAVYAAGTLSNLVAHYPFNGDADDESGNGFNGLVSGASQANDRFGQQGRAYGFDGTNDYIQLPSFPPVGSLSLSAWFSASYVPPSRHAFVAALYGRDQHPWMAAGLSTMNDSLVATLSYSDMTYSEIRAVPVTLNSWHHAVLIYDGSFGKLYFDNKLVWTSLVAKTLNIVATPSFIGRDRPSGTEYGFGSIDDVRFYGRVLSAGEVDSLFHLGGWAVPPAPPQLVYPQNGAGVTTSVVPFIWSKGSSDASVFWFETATDSLFVYRTIDSTCADTTKVATLPGLGKYWWRVKARNIWGWGPYSAAFRFAYGLTAAGQEENVPSEYVLRQNYPNPFNPSTKIRFGLPARAHVRLTVFNSLGQQIALLAEGEYEAGYHDALFDAAKQASGVYYCRMQAGDFVQVKRLVIVK